MKKAMFFVALLFLTACTVDSALDPELHGQIPADNTNLPGSPGQLDTISEMVPYYGDVEGYLARPTAEGEYPGVVMIHEWWGLNENIRSTADLLASEGYIVLAVDLYNGQVAQTPDEARQYMSSTTQDDALANMKSAVDYLKALNADSIASLGWCYGGRQSLQLGIAEDLDATIIYYGQLETDREALSAIEQPVLGFFGAEDAGIPVSSVEEFDSALNSLGIENSIYIYEGANHAFANPSGDRYNPEAAEDAWAKTLAFLDAELRG